MLEFIASNDVARIAALLLIFFIVLAAGLVGGQYVQRRANVRRELNMIAEKAMRPENHQRLGQQRDGAWFRLLEKIEKSGLSLADSRGDELRQRLMAAGYSSPSAPRVFTLIRVVLVVLLPSFLFLAIGLSGQELSLVNTYLLGVLFAVIGLYLPNLVVSAKKSRREEEIRRGFPDCLDLMLVCVEAGLGLESAMDRVGREMLRAHPLVAQLLSVATLQIRAGSTREAALRKLGELSQVDEIRSFGTLLIQSDKMGTSVADTLRVYAAEMREKRRLRAEERAYRLPVLISIPLVVCMLPTMIGVLMIPGVVRAVRTLFPALTGG
ncbi:type II secretion system F family protein [Aurantiacibacter gilvus]|uniref:Type II secretion system F family protein n=1 Tax=Aurantiacibacter gilvus TaxID=3139141 RepID=A0ABU9IF11_9SPHN